MLLGPVGELLQVLQPHADGELQLLAGDAALEVEGLLGADADQPVVRQHRVGLRKQLAAVPVVQHQGQRGTQVHLEPAVEVEPGLQHLVVGAVVEEVDAVVVPAQRQVAVVVDDPAQLVLAQDVLQHPVAGQHPGTLRPADGRLGERALTGSFLDRAALGESALGESALGEPALAAAGCGNRRRRNVPQPTSHPFTLTATRSASSYELRPVRNVIKVYAR